VVTARLRDEALQRVPMPVAALDALELQRAAHGTSRPGRRGSEHHDPYGATAQQRGHRPHPRRRPVGTDAWWEMAPVGRNLGDKAHCITGHDFPPTPASTARQGPYRRH
jgi:hypothetical protein